jgi:hypothetical protein
MSKPIILFESEEAAKFVTGISGWVDREGRFWGKDERMARWSGCTHRKCEQCDTVIERLYLICDACKLKKDIERYEALEKIDWDGNTPLYSHQIDKYFFDEDDLMFEIEENDCKPEEMRLVICRPNHLRQIDEDYFSDDLPEDGELPTEITSALEVLNKVIREHEPVSWSPSSKAIRIESLGI